MINKETRHVVIGDGDVKIALCEMGIMFGDRSVPDNNIEELEEDYMFGIHITPLSIKPINEMLDSFMNEDNKILDIGGTKIEFKNNEAIKEFRKCFVTWCDYLFEDVKDLQEYYNNTLKGQVE